MSRGAGDLSTFGKTLWTIGPPTLRVAGRLVFSLRIERHSELPEPPYVVAANHYSHLDPPAVGAAIGAPIRYLAVDELIGVSPLLDWTLDWFGAIPLTRSRIPLGALRTALEKLDSGEIVGVFPEGTRVGRWGDHVPKKGAGWLASRAGVPLVPVAVAGTNRVFGVDNKLRVAPITVVIGPTLEGADARVLTDEWSDWMSGQLARFR